jgi:hypothetical protein
MRGIALPSAGLPDIANMRRARRRCAAIVSSRGEFGDNFSPEFCRQDGLAHCGMLADFLCAIKLTPQGASAYQPLFRSPDDVVKI